MAVSVSLEVTPRQLRTSCTDQAGGDPADTAGFLALVPTCNLTLREISQILLKRKIHSLFFVNRPINVNTEIHTLTCVSRERKVWSERIQLSDGQTVTLQPEAWCLRPPRGPPFLQLRLRFRDSWSAHTSPALRLRGRMTRFSSPHLLSNHALMRRILIFLCRFSEKPPVGC